MGLITMIYSCNHMPLTEHVSHFHIESCGTIIITTLTIGMVKKTLCILTYVGHVV